ncbi:transmembrane protein 220-like [Scleropages formosus]|uniref:Transmembrane protein 220-like n=1 Tax=Scleropages formosus TaxID=113540 RepID=A0A0P7WUU4_SCLFO|nr:transmembrane protein 220-like [Scleropages formosus]
MQKNDPDAALWMFVWDFFPNGSSLPSRNCFPDIVLWRRLVDLHILVSTSIATLLGWTLLRRQSENILQQEEGREFCGLVLIVIWLLLCRMSRRKVGGVIHLFTAVTITLFPLVMWLYYYVNDDLRASWPSHCKTAL